MPADMIYVFDVDGTVAEYRQPPSDEMVAALNELPNCHFVSGARTADLEERFAGVPKAVLYGCMGNEINPPPDVDWMPVAEWCAEMQCRYPGPAKNWRGYVEIRPGLLNYSPIGRNPTEAEKAAFELWDNDSSWRRMACYASQATFNGKFRTEIGGRISIDIVVPGKGKEQIVPLIRKHHPEGPIIFFGDRIVPFGNDMALAEAIRAESPLNVVRRVKNPKQMLEWLKNLSSRST